jgi:hypothetical protein
VHLHQPVPRGPAGWRADPTWVGRSAGARSPPATARAVPAYSFCLGKGETVEEESDIRRPADMNIDFREGALWSRCNAGSPMRGFSDRRATYCLFHHLVPIERQSATEIRRARVVKPPQWSASGNEGRIQQHGKSALMSGPHQADGAVMVIGRRTEIALT